MPAVTYAKALDVIKLVSDGETILQACDKYLLTPAQFKATCQREPTLQAMLIEAEDIRDDILADILVSVEKLPSDHKMAHVLSANIKFLLERRRPMKYGKIAESSNPDSEANRLLALALNAAIDRIPQAAQQAKATITDVSFKDVTAKKEAAQPAPPSSPLVLGDQPAPVCAPDGLAELRRLGLI